jgi:hypothetical protein
MLVATSAHLFVGSATITGSEPHGTEPGSAQAPPTKASRCERAG